MVLRRPLTLQFIQERVACSNHRHPAVLLVAHQTTLGLLLVFVTNTLLYLVGGLQCASACRPATQLDQVLCASVSALAG